jgi:hypothetical protein
MGNASLRPASNYPAKPGKFDPHPVKTYLYFMETCYRKCWKSAKNTRKNSVIFLVAF